MRSAWLIAAGAGLAVSVSQAQAQVYASETVPVTISDNTEVSDLVIVAGAPASLTDLNVVIRITHTWDADLDFFLVGPAGGHICLSTDNGGSGDNFNTTRFDDAASVSITAGVAPFPDNFRPEGLMNTYDGPQGATYPAGTGNTSLAGFNGTNPNGTWTLWLYDDAGGDFGTIDYWSIEVNGGIDPQGPPPITGPTNPTGEPSYLPGNIIATGESLTFRVAVTPGSNPTSTGVGVSVDASQIGMGTVTLFDDGAHGDGAANDMLFANSGLVPAATPGGNYILNYTITDAQSRTGSGDFPSLQVVGAPPPCPPGTNSQSFTSVNSMENAGNALNVILDPAWPSGEFINTIHLSGRLVSLAGATYSAEARFLVHFADGSTTEMQPFTTFAPFGIEEIADYSVTLATPKPAAGVTIESFESFNDVGGGADAIWTNVCFTFDPQTTPTSPTGAGSPANAAVDLVTNFRVGVTPGLFPTSTFGNAGTGVTIDASSIGLGTLRLFDDGAHNDGAAGDNTWGLDAVISGEATPAGTYPLSFNILDNQGRSGTGSWTINVENLAGQLPSQPIILSGSGPLASITIDAPSGARSYLYQIEVCDAAAFGATTSGGSSDDTQLFLFDSTGKGVTHNDDSNATVQSTLTNAFVSSNGTYFLALSFYNRDPATASGGTIWANQPFGVERIPDGTDPASPITAWVGTGNPTGPCTIALTGACYPSAGCDPDYNEDGNSDQSDIAYLVEIIAGGSNPNNRDPDFNRDGNADQSDIALLVDIVAGGSCPL